MHLKVYKILRLAMINLLIQGKPRSGKSTLIQKVMDLLRQQRKVIGGISTPEIRAKTRIGFKIIDLMTMKEGILAHINQESGPRVSRYRVNLQDLEEVGTWAIQRAIENNVDVIIIDEIGKMELVSKSFQAWVWKALNLQKVLGTIGLISHPFISRIYERQDLKILRLTIQNRKEIFEQLLSLIIECT